ncbi:hypothetical protein GCM10025867_04170 [Frondihabitans sucicola]|uniref:Glycosyltransferase n=1 Tax=Frondihabitans sucicola TaxID=1268041 RepID=A0ABN6XT51_9MICO|nr:glycosyltransferase [Frondihabitans sucicola]BDZ48176.1 hypothetical protein GCM10025867_04170 [Frondihabitans sucicola]
MTAAPIRVAYYRVHDLDYPRNSRIRAHLDRSSAFDVRVVPLSSHPRRSVRILRDLRTLISWARRSDVLVLSELRLAHAAIVWFAGLVTGSAVVVDGFVGLHETAVGDWQSTSPRSLRARSLAYLDRIAFCAADLYLIDTAARATLLATRYGRAEKIVVLPVGAPAWAVPQAPREAQDRLRLLYYGNYIPLHGLDLVVDALHELVAEHDFEVTFIGNGALRAGIESKITGAGLADRSTFVDEIRESQLLGRIAAADVILGVFGSSAKATSVVANKVWQGLASGRIVVTADSEATRELAPWRAPSWCGRTRAIPRASRARSEPYGAKRSPRRPRRHGAPRELGDRALRCLHPAADRAGGDEVTTGLQVRRLDAAGLRRHLLPVLLYFGAPTLSALAPLAVIPAITSSLGARGWASTAIALAVGNAGLVIAEVGWGSSARNGSRSRHAADWASTAALRRAS